MHPTEFTVKSLIESCAGLIAERDISTAMEYNSHNEWGIAIEYLYSCIVESEIKISEKIFNLFKDSLDLMPGFREDILPNLKKFIFPT
jgi:hypothetical protein